MTSGGDARARARSGSARGPSWRVLRRTPGASFIIVSGTIGEDSAVEAMRAGAHDDVLEDRLVRLTTAGAPPNGELILDEPDLRAPVRADVVGIRTAAQRAAGLTRQLLLSSRAAVACGASGVDFLQKPLTPLVLAGKIREVLDRPSPESPP